MKKKPIIAAIMSIVIPGLGHMYAGESNKGAIIIAVSIIIGSLNIIILPLIAIANPNITAINLHQQSIWAYWIPRIVHDVLALWSIVFLIWVIIDAYKSVNKKQKVL